MAFIQIPLSNTLRMVRTDNQGSNLQNFDNRLLHQEDYVDYNDRPYYQKVSGSDVMLIQFATDVALGSITAGIYNLSNVLVSDETSNISLILTSTSFSFYNLSITVATEGFYYLKITFGTPDTYQSEYFQIDGYETDNVLKIEYNTSENDGIIYDNSETFVIRLEGRLVEYKPGQEKEVYENYNQALVNLNSFPIRAVTLEYGPIPRYMVEKLNLALSHQVFKVNDVEYQSKDGPDTSLLKDGVVITNLYADTVNLQQVDYEDYEAASDDVAPDTFLILIDETTGKLIIKDSGTEYNTRYKD
jgi:hypothetical protein